MLKYIHYVIPIAVIIISINSCRELVTDEFANPDLIPVLNAIVVPGEPVEIQASYTANINSSTIEFIDDAEISLYTNGRELSFKS